MAAPVTRDASAAEQHLSDHIVLRRDQIAEAIRLTLARLETA